MYDLKGKVVLVTGAGGELGIGRAIATRLASEGADIIANDVTDNPYSDHETKWRGISSLVEEIETLGRQAVAEVADVSNYGQVQEMVNRGVERFGHIDILVNNAGIFEGGTVEDTTSESWDRVLDINAKGVFLGTKAAIPELKKNGGGSIVNISSVAGLVGNHISSAYTASKGAVRLFTKSTAIQYASDGIRANSVHPGTIETPMTAALLATPEYRQDRMDRTPIGRLGTPEDVAYGVLYLASDEASFVTGAELVIDGGRTAE